MSGKAEDQPVIKEITSPESLGNSAAVIRTAFQTVAQEFGLTRQNNPTHPSFMTTPRLRELLSQGMRLFGLFQGDMQVGFVTVDPTDRNIYGIRNLAVLPQFRHHQYGRLLVQFALEYSRAHQARAVELSLINDNQILKKWYGDMGFKETALKNFPHLPFTVSFMQHDLS